MKNLIYSYEDKALLGMVNGASLKILDVGCGQGRYLVPLSQVHQVTGIDANIVQVSQMKSRGFDVLHVSEDLPSNVSFDYIIMSHIIEHIQPLDLINFLNRYLSKLAPTGSLLIATPLLHRGFYDDYDHVKPYTPKALEVLFSDYIQQQAKTMFSMKLTNLWMRKWPLQIELNSSNNKLERRIASYVNRVGELSYWLSHGIISETTGWVGEFRLVTHKM